jgi:hypothetical protein
MSMLSIQIIYVFADLHAVAYNKSCLNKLQSIQHIDSLPNLSKFQEAIAIQQLI